MSLYGRRKGILDFDRVDGVPSGVTTGGNGQTPGAGARGRSATARDESEFAAQRKAAPADYLLTGTLAWLRSVPVDVAPKELAVEFPRILNLIAHQWGDRRVCPQYLSELLVDRRGGRRGFPSAVYAEIQALRAYWYAQS